ncbi:uncharacterized protein EV422DRAFT_31015 [Fimicolochytrium jonesii]|uniref:uncharacterized protein n=1 Tax=Fimicolochytrium jonesii TaxID=1396493 RepID=UPI0022FEF615|nr:uncharacterized protein EV422DRAFT_31015 [Fimicolochytrium jonesii]KAI8827195.1 hypothetical protein EV422DRAFT_31015 [Fimicolochytrium jonesii]
MAARQGDADSTTYLLDMPPEAPMGSGTVLPCPRNRLSARLAKLLESHSFHVGILILVALDLGCVIAELVVSFMELEHQCDSTGQPLPNPDEPEETLWLHLLSLASLVILALFILEHAARMCVFGVRYYIHNPLHLFDLTVVLASLVLEVVLKGAAGEIAGLLIVLRCWRLVRVIDGVATAVETTTEERMVKLEEENRGLREEVRELRRRVGVDGAFRTAMG